jgi:RNA polymerase sigma factor (sigma-70 family)
MGQNQAEAQPETLYRKYAGSVFRYALRRGCPKADAEDVVVETFVSCWRRLAELPEEPLPWIIATARGVLANERRAEIRRKALSQRIAQAEGTAEAPTPEEHQPSPEEKNLLLALSELSPKDREALLLVEWDGLSTAEAAAVLGSSCQAVRHRLSRSRRLLREKLGIVGE